MLVKSETKFTATRQVVVVPNDDRSDINHAAKKTADRIVDTYVNFLPEMIYRELPAGSSVTKNQIMKFINDEAMTISVEVVIEYNEEDADE